MAQDCTKAKSVFTWLEDVRARPSMYIGDASLRELETLIYGYYAGLHTHGLIEHVPEMINVGRVLGGL